MKYRGWAEEEPPTWVTMVLSIIAGVYGFYNLPGWILIYFGLLSFIEVLAIGAAIGIIFGVWIIWEKKQVE